MEQKVKALFAWTENGEKTAKQIGDQYGKAGMEIIFHGQAAKEELVLLGEERGMTHVLYFLDQVKVILVSLTDEMGGFTVEVMLEDLLLPH